MTTIQTTLGALVTAEAPLARLANLKLPVMVAYRLAKLCTLVRAELKTFEAQRQAHIGELGEDRDPTVAEAMFNGGQKVREVTPANWPEFSTRMDALMAITVEIAYGPLNLSLFPSEMVTAQDLIALGPLVMMPEDAPNSTETQGGNSI